MIKWLGTLVFVCAGTASAETTTAATPPIPNFHEVNSQIFRSGHVEDADFNALESFGVRSVLSLEDTDVGSADHENAAATTAGLQFDSLAMSLVEKPTLAEIDAALAYLTDPAHQPTLVHCTRGSDRTGIVIAAYRIRYDHWTEEQAIAELRQYGHSPLLYWWDDVLDEVQ